MTTTHSHIVPVARPKSVASIIHGSSMSAAAVGAGLAQVPGSDAPVLVGIQSTMIVGIASAYGASLTKGAAAKLILPFSASVTGRGLSQALIGWMPGLGNAINASTALGLTQAIGWAADAYFSKTSN